MAVLFPTPSGYMLNPGRSAEMVQGFLNIEAAEGATNGRLTQAQIQHYQQSHGNVIDANTAVANYLSSNFNTLAKQSSENTAISIDDLVTVRKGLPSMPPVNNPPLPEYTYSPNNGSLNNGYGSFNPGNSGQGAGQLMLAIMMQMFQMMASLLGGNSQ